MSTSTQPSLAVFPVIGVGEIVADVDLADVLLRALDAAEGSAGLADRDVLVVTQKIVSKAEGRVVAIDDSDPDAKLRLIESEAVRVLRRRGELVITETAHGFVCANSGVDLSNMALGTAALLPVDPDRSARRLRADIRRSRGVDVAVIVSDTFGRAWRRGVVDVAIGSAGLAAIVDLRGTEDAMGRELVATEICIADEVAAAAELVMGKDRGIPAAVVRGLNPEWFADGSVREDIVRPHHEDLFR